LASWQELHAAVAGGGLSVGSHASAHGDLTLMTASDQMRDLRASRERIEQELDCPCEAIAYPYGRCNEDSLEAARAAGYACAVTADNGFNRIADNPFRLKRVMAGDKGSLPLFDARLSGAWDELKGHSPPV